MTKRIIAFICVLALVVSMCSVFSFAAEPDVKVPQEGTRTGGVHYVVKRATHLYVGAGTGGYVFSGYIPVGAHLVRQDNLPYGPNNEYYKVMYNSYVGYVNKNDVTEVQ